MYYAPLHDATPARHYTTTHKYRYTHTHTDAHYYEAHDEIDVGFTLWGGYD